jgi:hypothetical protein
MNEPSLNPAGPVAVQGASSGETVVPAPPSQVTPGPVASARKSGLLIRNLLAIAALCVATSFWVLSCTSWFPVVGGLLGLGGVLAWVGFISGLLTDESKNILRAEFETRVAYKPSTWRWCLGLFAVLLFVASFFGTIELRSFVNKEALVYRPHPTSSAARSASELLDVLSPFERTRRLVLTGWGERRFRVRVGGLPYEDVPVRSLFPTQLAIPASFGRRPLVLVRADSVLTANAGDPERHYALVVAVDGKVVGLIRQFSGNSVWVGCNDDVEIPESLRQSWRREFSDVPLAWLSPVSLSAGRAIEVNQTVKAWLIGDASKIPEDQEVDPAYFSNLLIIGQATERVRLDNDRILEIVVTPGSGGGNEITG